MSPFPTIELYDRLAIAELKWEKTGANKEELEWYQGQLTVPEDLKDLFNELKHIHSLIWSLEWELKTGQEEKLELAEIGRRAIAIRDMNNKRIAFKNTIAEKLNDPVREIKQDHLSE